MNKVILTKEQAKAMEELKSEHLTGEVVKTHLNDRWSLGLESLNDLTVDEFAQAYYSEDGYEVESEFKKGDYVMVKWKNREKEEFYRVISIDPWGSIQIETLDGVPNASGHENTRLATPSEIAEEKERRFFVGHGREPWELRLYDAVKRTTTKIPLFVVEISRDYLKNTTSYKLSDGSIQKKENMKELFEVLYFAEQRLDVKTNE